MSNVVIYAEKPDVAYKIATAFGGVEVKIKGSSVQVNMDNYEKYKSMIIRKYSSQGYVPVFYKGNDYKITWGTGHMCALKQAYDYNPDYKSWREIPKPFFPENYEIKIREGYNPKTRRALKVDPSAKKQLDIVKKLFKECDYIINATDDDREGELIFAYVYEYTNTKKPYKRVFLESFTEDALQDTFTRLKDMSEVKSIEMAGRARNIADWIVGANLTVASTLQYGKGEIISVGRVQTPTLKILVDRENEIKNFKPSTNYYLEAEFTTTDGSTYKGVADKIKYENKKDAENVAKSLQNEPGVVIIYSRKDGYRQAPLLYSLSSLSIDANREFGLTAKKTLDTAQKLYTDGYLTYPRTSSCYLPDDMKGTVHTVLDNLGKDKNFEKFVSLVPRAKREMTKRHFDSKKVESHYAIIPTTKIPDLSRLSADEKNIYTLVALSVIRAVFPPAKIQYTNIETKVGDEIFYSSGNVILEKNWLAVNTGKSKEDELPILNVGDKVDPDIKVQSSTTRAPSRFTDSSLLAAMLSAGKTIDDKDLRSFMSINGDGGIGTEATRAGIIETVITRKYAVRQGKYIVPTEKGMRLVEVLPIEDLKSPELTAKWEARLNDIQQNKDTLSNFVSDLEKQTTVWTKEVLKTEMSYEQNKNIVEGLSCPNCGGELMENQYGFFCTCNERDNPDSCQFRLFKASDKFKFSPNMTVNDLKKLIEEGHTGEKNAISREGHKYKFHYVLGDDNQTLNMEFPKNNTDIQDTEFICPICGKPLVHVKNDEKDWDFYSCRNHVIVGADFFGTPLSKDNIKALLDNEQVGPLTFRSKNGEEYEGFLYLDLDEGKVKRVRG